MSEVNSEVLANEITVSKVFEAPKEQVFAMFKDPERLASWWGPATWPATIETFEFRPGGIWHYYMTGPDGRKAWGKATFQDIDEPDSISYVDVFSNEAGDFDESMPQGLSTVTFEEVEGGTKLTMVSEYPSNEDARKIVEMGGIEGVTDTLGQLEKLLATQAG